MQGSMQCAHSRLRGLRAHGRSSSGAAAALAQPARSRGARATPVPGSQQPCGGLRPTSAQPRERPLPPLRTAGTAGGAVAVGDAPPGGQSGASSTASTSSSSSSLTPERAARLAAPVIIVGGGPAGLATALMLARRGYTNVKVYERLPEPPEPDAAIWDDFDQASERLYMIGLNGRGQAVLRNLGLMDRIDAASSLVLGRLDWRPDTPPDKPALTRYEKTRTYKTRCIQRDRLAACILAELRSEHAAAVAVEFGVACAGSDWRRGGDGKEVCRLTLRRQGPNGSAAATAGRAAADAAAGPAAPEAPAGAPDEWVEEAGLVVGADGAGSALRDAMAGAGGPLRVRRYPDKNVIVYRTIPLFWPEEMAAERPGDLNYSARTKSGLNLDCLPTRAGPFIGVMLYKPGDPQIAALKTAADVRALFERNFPAFLPALRESDLERFAAKPDSSLPTFSYAGPVLHRGSSTVLLGDAIHTVKPYFGQGVNSAFEDVAVLERALDEVCDDAAAAAPAYSRLRAADAEALVVLSHSLDGGFLTFIGPLILDSMLNKLLPAVFSPNIIASLQNEKWSFSQIRRRKRVDRAMQVALLAAAALLAARALAAVLGLAARLVGRVLGGA